jgi:hypothetical protein
MSGTVQAGYPGVNIADRSGTITTGGVAQTLMPANPQRRGFWVQNHSAADLWVSGVGTAAASQPAIRIPAGLLYESPDFGVVTSAMSIFGASTGQAFSAREMF